MKISIIIPTIGRETLEKVLESIFVSKKNIECEVEVLVVFDGKKKNFEFPENWRKNIKILETGKKLFASGARNLGIEKAKGEILVFIGDNGMVDKNWLNEIFEFHQKNPEKEKALLGNISWQKKDDFTEFFEKNIQFDFDGLEKSEFLNKDMPSHVPTWRYFYTSNISLKREFLNITPSLRDASGRLLRNPLNLRGDKEDNSLMLFSAKFSGWGFEDSELGYRLEKKGMKINYDKNCKVFRLDKPTFESMIEKIKSARKNAQIFEALHPEIKILPRGLKLFLLKILITLSFLPSKLSQKIFWWREWKKAWIGGA